MLNFWRSSIVLKIALPAIIVMLLFGVPAWFGWRYSQVTAETNEQFWSRNRALFALREMESAVQQEIILVHEVAFEDNAGAVDRFTEVVATVERADAEAATHIRDSEEAALNDLFMSEHTDSTEYFYNFLAPARERGDREAAAQTEQVFHEHHEMMLAQLDELYGHFVEHRDNALLAREEARSAVGNAAVASLALAMALAAAATFFVSRRVARPVRELSAAAAAVSAGDFGQRLDEGSRDELGRMAHAFNSMTASLKERTGELERERAQISSIHQSLGDGILVVDREGVIISVNPSAEVALGRPTTELVGSTDTGVPALQEVLGSVRVPETKCWIAKQCTHLECPSYESEDLRCWLQCGTYCHNQIQGTFRQKRDACERCDVFRRNAVRELDLRIGGRRHYSVAIVPILDDEGQDEGSTVVFHDVTELHEAQEKLKRRSHDLQVLNSVNEAVSRSLSIDETLEAALSEVLKVHEGYSAAIHLIDAEDGSLRLGTYHDLSANMLEAVSHLPAGMGCPSHVVREDRAVVFGDLKEDGVDVPPVILEEGYRSYIGVPLESKKRAIGVLSLCSRRVQAFNEDHVSLLTAVGHQVGVAIENSLLYEDSVETARKVLARNHIVATLASSLELSEIFDDFTGEIGKLVDFDRITIALAEEDGQMLRVIASRGTVPGIYREGDRLPAAGTAAAWAMAESAPHVSGDIAREMRFSEQKHLLQLGFRSQLNIPLVARGDVLGTLNLVSTRTGAFIHEVVEELKVISGQLAMALANQGLYEAAARARNEWEATFNSASDGIVVINNDRQVVHLNQAAVDILGGSAEEYTGRTSAEVLGRIEIKPEAVEAAADDRSKARAELKQELNDGRVIEVVVDVMRDSDGNRIGSVCFLRDVTEARRLRKQLMQSEKMVAVGQLVSGVAHEINNPLTGVAGYSQLLLSRDLDEKTRKDVEAIYREAERATRIVRQLLSFARKHQPEKKQVDINEVVRESLELKAYDLRVNNIRVQTALEEGLPPTTADPHLLQQVFLNLITNAEHAMLDDRGGGELKVSTTTTSGRLRISFSDDGPGIPDELRDRIFDPFFTTKDVGKGTGLGLSVCYGMIEDHGGNIWAEPSSGRGATFVIELPILSEPVAEAPVVASPAEDVQGRLGKILLVDDEAAIRQALSKILRDAGHTVEAAENGEVALGMLKRNRYDCVVSDVKMPRMDGPALHQAVSSIDPDLAGSFIFISGDTVNPETRSYLDRINNPHLTKPFRLKDLEEVLQQVLSQKTAN